jgi:hypothetical protein
LIEIQFSGFFRFLTPKASTSAHQVLGALTILIMEHNLLGEVLREEAVLVGKSVDRSIRTGLRANQTAEGKRGGLASEVTISIDVADVDLDGGMIARRDDAVGGRALAGNEKLNRNTLYMPHLNKLSIQCKNRRFNGTNQSEITIVAVARSTVAKKKKKKSATWRKFQQTSSFCILSCVRSCCGNKQTIDGQF